MVNDTNNKLSEKDKTFLVIFKCISFVIAIMFVSFTVGNGNIRCLALGFLFFIFYEYASNQLKNET